jgi:hypothetical protein
MLASFESYYIMNTDAQKEVLLGYSESYVAVWVKCVMDLSTKSPKAGHYKTKHTPQMHS